MNQQEKSERYTLLLPQLRSLCEGEEDMIVKMANFCSLLHETMNFFWTGFYRVKNNTLSLGPFQGTIACSHIPFGKGVCGKAWEAQQTIIVPNVHKFKGHIACSSLSQSEIVVPIYNKERDIFAVLDIDSTQIDTFDIIDQQYLEEAVTYLT